MLAVVAGEAFGVREEMKLHRCSNGQHNQRSRKKNNKQAGVRPGFAYSTGGGLVGENWRAGCAFGYATAGITGLNVRPDGFTGCASNSAYVNGMTAGAEATVALSTLRL